MAKAKFEADEAPRERRDDRARGPRKTTLTAALTKWRRQGLATYVTYTSGEGVGIAGRRDATKILTIGGVALEYATAKSALRARGLPGARRLREEHDHGGRPRWDGAILVGVGGGRADAADAEHILLARQVNVPPLSCS